MGHTNKRKWKLKCWGNISSYSTRTIVSEFIKEKDGKLKPFIFRTPVGNSAGAWMNLNYSTAVKKFWPEKISWNHF